MAPTFLPEQGQNLSAHRFETADATFVPGFANYFGMNRQSARTQIRSKCLLNDGALCEPLDDSQNPTHGLGLLRSRSSGEVLPARSPSTNPPTVPLPAAENARRLPRARLQPLPEVQIG